MRLITRFKCADFDLILSICMHFHEIFRVRYEKMGFLCENLKFLIQNFAFLKYKHPKNKNLDRSHLFMKFFHQKLHPRSFSRAPWHPNKSIFLKEMFSFHPSSSLLSVSRKIPAKSILLYYSLAVFRGILTFEKSIGCHKRLRYRDPLGKIEKFV